jgi:hypothetical protein
MANRYKDLPEGVHKHSKIWRYMSLAKFHSLLSTKALYFTRLDCLDDHLEAMLSPLTVSAHVEGLLTNPDIQKRLAGRPDGEEIAHLQIGTQDMLMRASTFVNCWFQSDIESMAMWQTYGRDGVAIQSTMRRLYEVLPDEVAVTKVAYIDYSREANSSVIPWAYKDKIFEGEQEVRAAIKRPPTASSIIAVNRDHARGVPMPVRLDHLIKKVYIAPRSASWFRRVIEEMLATYNLSHKEVVTSGAEQQPDYRRLFAEARELLIEKAYPLEPYEDDDPLDDPWGYKAAMAAAEAAKSSVSTS